jgi:CRP-like cAMP-binding protein
MGHFTLQSAIDDKDRIKRMRIQDAQQRLATTGWLAQVPADFRDAFLAAGRLQPVAGSAMFGLAGEVGEGMWGIVSGQVALTSAMNSTDAPLGLLLNPGRWGGYVPLFGQPARANAHATVDSLILRVSFAEVRRLLAGNPAGWEYLGRLTLEDSLCFATVAVDLLLKDATRRIAAILLHQAGCRGTGMPPWPIHLTQAEIGEMAGLSRHPTRQVLLALETRGWVERGYRCLHVREPDPMRRFADGG